MSNNKIGLIQTSKEKVCLYLPNISLNEFCSKLPETDKMIFDYLVLSKKNGKGFYHFRRTDSEFASNPLGFLLEEITVNDFLAILAIHSLYSYEYSVRIKDSIYLETGEYNSLIIELPNNYQVDMIQPFIASKFPTSFEPISKHLSQFMNYLFCIDDKGNIDTYNVEYIEDFDSFMYEEVSRLSNKMMEETFLKFLKDLFRYYNQTKRLGDFKKLEINITNTYQLIFSGLIIDGQKYSLVVDTESQYLMFLNASSKAKRNKTYGINYCSM